VIALLLDYCCAGWMSQLRLQMPMARGALAALLLS